MRKGFLITGIILLLVGLLSIAYPMFIGSSSSIAAYPNVSEPVSPIVGSGTFTLHWSGATSSTHIVLYQCPGSDCSQMGPVLANVSGASGSLSVTLQAGQSYGVYEYGTPISVPATATLVGISLLVLIGIILAVIGVVVLVLSLVSKARAPAPPAPMPETPAEPSNAPPMMPVTSPMASPAAVTAAEDPKAQQGTIMSGPKASAGERANLICASCGTVNEPWITNCRKCKRPLASTSR